MSGVGRKALPRLYNDMASTLPTFTDLENVTQNVTIYTSEHEVKVFADLAACKAFTPDAYTKTCVVVGLGHFYWDDDDTSVADDTTIIQPDAGGDGRWLVIP